jgi:D-beta-D-heptose 7-phosphate kinase/D-beta-D-heptose 1-phosphate adenosyltransferase
MGALISKSLVCGLAMKTTSGRKIVDIGSLGAICESYRKAGKSVVWTNGFFDLLHPGHISSLQAASSLGDVLIVGINSDLCCRQLKGPGRPILTEYDRAQMLAALECVDHVTIFSEPTPVDVLKIVRPDVHCKGMDYASGRVMPERAVVESYGGRVELLPMSPGLSTTDLIHRIQQIRDSDGQ